MGVLALCCPPPQLQGPFPLSTSTYIFCMSSKLRTEMLNSNTPKLGYWHSQCQHQHFCLIEISGLWSTPFPPNLCIQQIPTESMHVPETARQSWRSFIPVGRGFSYLLLCNEPVNCSDFRQGLTMSHLSLVGNWSRAG